MAKPITNPNVSFNWLSLGQIRPPLMDWANYNQFTEYSGTLRITAFSFFDDYTGRCYLRIKYNLITPVFSNWIRVYPNSEGYLIYPSIDPNFANVSKNIQVSDQRRKILSNFPKPVNWLLKVDLLQIQ